MVVKFLLLIRRSVRFLAGMFFWLNALLVFSIPRPSLDLLSNNLGLNVSEALLIGFFVSMAALNSYGFSKFLVDVLYIYGFPFVLAYHFTVLFFRVLWRVVKLVPKVAPLPTSTSDWKSILALLNPSSDRVVINVSPEPPKAAVTKQPRNWRKTITDSFALPFSGFTFMWCLLIAATSKTPLLAVAFVVVVLHTAKFCAGFAGLAATANQLLSGAEKRVFEYMEQMLSKIMRASLDAPADADINLAVSTLLFYRACAFVIISRAEITYGIFILGCVLYAVVYLRVALLFAFIYIGVSKMQGIPMTFLDSMFNSLGMPFSYTFFPHNWSIQLAQLVHILALLALGVGAITAYIRRKLNTFEEAARNVWTKLQEQEVRERLDELWRKTPAGQAAAKKTAAT